MTHFIYTLSYDMGTDEHFFYVGHTDNPDRRYAEHLRDAFAVNGKSYNTLKYRWIRHLASIGIEYHMKIAEIMTGEYDQDGEYEWILKAARENKKNQLFFFGFPLTNMKAGDFTSEILDRDIIRSRVQIKKYREIKERQALEATLERGQQARVTNPDVLSVLDTMRSIGQENAANEAMKRAKADAREAKRIADVAARTEQLRKEAEALETPEEIIKKIEELARRAAAEERIRREIDDSKWN